MIIMNKIKEAWKIMAVLPLFFMQYAFGQTIKEAQKAIEFEKFETAKSILNKVVLADPKKKAEAYFYLGISFLRGLNFNDPAIDIDSASHYFNQGLQVNASQAFNHIGLGAINLSNGKEEEAKKHFDQAEILAPKEKDVPLYIGRIYTQINNKNINTAFTYLEKAVLIDEKSATVYLALGDADLAKNDATAAIIHYNRAQELDRNLLATYLRQSAIYRAAKNYKAAFEPLNEATKRDSLYAPAYKALAELYAISGQHEKAIKTYQNVFLPLADKSCNTDILHATLLFQAKEYEATIQKIEEVLSKCSVKPVMYRLLGYAAHDAKKEDSTADAKKKDSIALRAMNIFFEKQDSTRILILDYQYMVDILRANKQDSLALIYVKKVLDLNPDNLPFIRSKAKTFYDSKNYKAADMLYSKIPSEKRNAQDLFYTGSARYFLKNYAQADSTFSELNQLKPDYIVAYAYRGYIAVSKNTAIFTTKAKPFFDKVIELGEKDKTKYKSFLVNAYQYSGQYEVEKNKSKEGARFFMNKILEIDPENIQAKNTIKALDAPPIRNKK